MHDLKKLTELTGIRQKVFLDRYSLKDEHGNPLEQLPEEMWRRVARGIASVEKPEVRAYWEEEFYNILKDFQFVPGGRILTGAGTPHKVTFYNCYVIPSPQDSREGIIDTLKLMTEIMARGGGVGINFSSLRPRGSYIKTVNGTASGPCSWMQLFSVATGEVIQQGGCFGPTVKIETSHGSIYAKELAEWIDRGEPIEALTHKGYRPIVHAFQNGKKQLFEVKTYDGQIIQVTKDHKMGVLRGNEIVTIPLEHLHIGSPIMCYSPALQAYSTTAISSIIPIGEDETYDFEVEDAHMITANGIYTSNSRRGALMCMLDDDHPDIEEFITVKKTPGMITHANLSVCVSDKFMKAVQADNSWHLTWQGEVKKTIRARDLWDLICTSAWESAEPGLVFMERCNREANTWYYEKLRCVNPCGEQILPDFGVCNLGAVNLAAFVTDHSLRRFDTNELISVVKKAMRFLDNVIDATDYFISENKEAQLGTRRTGLGTMGLADTLIKLGYAYGSKESLAFIDSVYSGIRNAAYEASIEIAKEKGCFPKFDRDKYLEGKFIQRLPEGITDQIEKYGIRNAVLLTQAPTGTTSLLAGVSSGIEPVYDFAMVRRDRTGEHVMYHPLVQEWRKKHPGEKLPKYFVSSKDLTPEEHVAVQAQIQKYTDASISKTVNAPNDHTIEQVRKLYMLAYEMGCKGVTYYRDGSRDAVLTRIEDEKKQVQPIGMKKRPEVVQGYTRQVVSPEGKVNVTINSDEDGPIEAFVNVGKAGTDIAALSEALGRLISLALQIPSDLPPAQRAREIAKQLRGIGGSRFVGFGSNQVKSLPDAVARVLEAHHGEQPERHSLGNLCPECGSLTLIYEEGCKKCHDCGYSEC